MIHSSYTVIGREKKFLQDYNNTKDFLDKMKID